MRPALAPLLATLFLASIGSCGAALAPTLQPAASDDLRISGLFQSTADGSVRYVSRDALLGLPGNTHLHEAPTDSIPPGDLTVLPIDRLLDALPLATGADGLILICSDRWESFMPVSLVRDIHPYLLLKYDGRTPAQGWPRFSPNEGMSPYFSNWSPALGPKDTSGTPFGEFDATQIVEIRAVNTSARYAPFYAGALAHLSPTAQKGRALFIRECNMCHQGPGGVGGNTSQRPLALLEQFAVATPDHFKAMVIKPTTFYPQTVMPPHDFFTAEMMAQLIAFLTEARAAGVDH